MERVIMAYQVIMQVQSGSPPTPCPSDTGS